jgi:hypothetical protein
LASAKNGAIPFRLTFVPRRPCYEPSDAALRSLTQNKNIETLLIGGTRVTDDGLAILASFPRLRKVSLFDTAVTDAGMKHLAGLPQLEVLLVAKSRVTDAGIAEIKRAHPKLSFDENI